jgi:hypothetical protein
MMLPAPPVRGLVVVVVVVRCPRPSHWSAEPPSATDIRMSSGHGATAANDRAYVAAVQKAVCPFSTIGWTSGKGHLISLGIYTRAQDVCELCRPPTFGGDFTPCKGRVGTGVSCRVVGAFRGVVAASVSDDGDDIRTCLHQHHDLHQWLLAHRPSARPSRPLKATPSNSPPEGSVN